MNFFDRYSYVLVSFVLVAAGIFFTFTNPSRANLLGIVTLVVGGVLIIYWVLARRGALTPVNPAKRIRRGRTSERPVVVHFYHDFHLGSLLMRPFTAKAERLERGHCDFIFIDAAHREAEGVMEDLDAGVGDWVLFDTAGKLVENTGRITPAKLEALRQRPVH